MAHEIDHASLIFCYLFPTTNLLHTLYLSPMEAVLFIELPSSDSSAPHVLPPATKSICWFGPDFYSFTLAFARWSLIQIFFLCVQAQNIWNWGFTGSFPPQSSKIWWVLRDFVSAFIPSLMLFFTFVCAVCYCRLRCLLTCASISILQLKCL